MCQNVLTYLHTLQTSHITEHIHHTRSSDGLRPSSQNHTMSMIRGSKSFFSSRKGGGNFKVAKHVQKVYLRTDIPCGVNTCPQCAKYYTAAFPAPLTVDTPILLPDTNVILHNIDAIESPAVKNVVILDTVLAEVKNLNRAVYGRLAKVIKEEGNPKRFYVFSNENHVDTACQTPEEGESANDHNDRMIRSAAKWYLMHLAQSNLATHVDALVLLTHDRANHDKAVALQITSMSIAEYVQKHLKDEKDLLNCIQTAVPEVL